MRANYNRENGGYPEETPNYWMSYSDMMSGLLLVFILFLTISMLMFNETSESLAETQDRLSVQEKRIENIIGIRQAIIEKLNEAFADSELNVRVDQATGAITFSDGVLFSTARYDIKPTGKSYLASFIPKYIEVLLDDEIRPFISEIIIEGHTDSMGTYMYNLDLSQRRAFEVSKYILGPDFNAVNDRDKESLRRILTANGRSYSQLILNENGTENRQSSRRVEFKFRLKDEEMIHEMDRILKEAL